MARPYSEQFLISLQKADPTRIGVQLGKICVKANLPTTYVAEAFNVSRMSIHSWFRGQYVREKNYERITKFIELVNKGLDKGTLPAMSPTDAKDFISSKVIDKI
jgi:hypothetical protein